MYSSKALVNQKQLVITYQDSLIANTTYTINFNRAIKDYNEGNYIEQYVYAFSTGDYLDTMQVAGLVLVAYRALDSTLTEQLWRLARAVDDRTFSPTQGGGGAAMQASRDAYHIGGAGGSAPDGLSARPARGIRHELPD